MPGVVSNPSPFPSAFTIHSDAEYEVTVGRKTSRSGSNDRGIIFRRKASSSILTIRAGIVADDRPLSQTTPQGWDGRGESGDALQTVPHTPHRPLWPLARLSQWPLE